MKREWLVCLCGMACLPLLLFTACEVASSSDTQLDLVPRNATVRNGESVVFTVSGGYDYRWWLKNETLGALNTRTGNQVIYTSLSTIASNSVSQELYVQSYIIGASGNNPTNIVGSNTAVGATSTAFITHVP